MPEKFDSRVGGGKEMDPHEALYFAEAPDESKLEGFSPEQQKQIIRDALSAAAHDNMTSGAEILRIAQAKGILNTENLLPALIEAVKRDVGKESEPDDVLRSLHNAHSFLGNTLKGLTGASTVENAKSGQTDDYREARDKKEGIFGW